jgi:hypothetical protein
MLLISWGKVEKPAERMLRVAPFLSMPLFHDVVCASIHLLQESTCVGLTCKASRWACSPLAVKMTSVVSSGE